MEQPQKILPPEYDDKDVEYAVLEDNDAAILFKEDETRLVVPERGVGGLEHPNCALAIAIYMRLSDEEEEAWRQELLNWMNEIGTRKWLALNHAVKPSKKNIH